MKNLKQHFLLLAILSMVCTAKAQYGYAVSGGNTQITLEAGDVAALKGTNKVNIKYDYSKMAVGSFRNEKDYIAKKEADLIDDPEKFEKFKQSWFESRSKRYEPKFEEMFNKMGESVGLQGENYASDGSVTLLVETVFTEPGYHAGVIKRPSSVDLLCTYFDYTGKEIARFFVKNAIGAAAMGMDYDAGSRLVESYAKGCKVLMKDVVKRLKKLE